MTISLEDIDPTVVREVICEPCRGTGDLRRTLRSGVVSSEECPYCDGGGRAFLGVYGDGSEIGLTVPV